MMVSSTLIIGVSQCLVGDEVRYDGTHQKIPFLTDKLSEFARFITVCPEVSIGMSVPRPPIELVISDQGIRAQGVVDRKLDVTDSLKNVVSNIESDIKDMDGYVLTHKSPSCGLGSVKRVQPDGTIVDRKGTGIFAQALMEHFPHIPLIEAADLLSIEKRHVFLIKVFLLRDFKESVIQSPSVSALIAFHSRYKYLVMAFSPRAYKSLGQFVARMKGKDCQQALDNYVKVLLSVFDEPVSVGRHVNAAQHMFGYFKEHLSATEKQQFFEALDAYMSQVSSLHKVNELLLRYSSRFSNDYIAKQTFLAPYPFSLSHE